MDLVSGRGILRRERRRTGSVPVHARFLHRAGHDDRPQIPRADAARRTKVIVLDCDQTLWAGVCGEDGAQGICLDEAAPRLQALHAKTARRRAAAGRVRSKNNEEDVREVFTRRTDMPLRLEHFAASRTQLASEIGEHPVARRGN